MSEMLLSETARVVALEENAVWLETIRQSSCGACSLQKGCGQSALQSLFSGQRHHIRLSTEGNMFELAVNDSVEIGIPKTAVLHGSLLLYLFPLLALIIGMVVAKNFALNDGWALLSGAIMMASSMFLIHKISARPTVEALIMPKILRVLPSSDLSAISKPSSEFISLL